MPPCFLTMDFTIALLRATWALPPSQPMNERQIWFRSQPLRWSTFIRPLLTSDESTLPFFRVAKENSVSRESDTRVMDGVASLVEISCIAASPASQDGKK